MKSSRRAWASASASSGVLMPSTAPFHFFVYDRPEGVSPDFARDRAHILRHRRVFGAMRQILEFLAHDDRAAGHAVADTRPDHRVIAEPLDEFDSRLHTRRISILPQRDQPIVRAGEGAGMLEELREIGYVVVLQRHLALGDLTGRTR